MPNPYHDENGKFCSRNEMQAAIDRVEKNGDVGTYLRLRSDLETADNTAFKEVLTEETIFGTKERIAANYKKNTETSADGWGGLFATDQETSSPAKIYENLEKSLNAEPTTLDETTVDRAFKLTTDKYTPLGLKLLNYDTVREEFKATCDLLGLAQTSQEPGVFLPADKTNTSQSYALAARYAQGLPAEVQDAIYQHVFKWSKSKSKHATYGIVAKAVFDTIKPF